VTECFLISLIAGILVLYFSIKLRAAAKKHLNTEGEEPQADDVSQNPELED